MPRFGDQSLAKTMARWTAVLRWARMLESSDVVNFSLCGFSICPSVPYGLLSLVAFEGSPHLLCVFSTVLVASYEYCIKFSNGILFRSNSSSRRSRRQRFLFCSNFRSGVLKMYIYSSSKNSQKGLIFAGDKLAFLIRRELPVYKQGNKFEEQIHDRYPKHLCLRNCSAFQTSRTSNSCTTPNRFTHSKIALEMHRDRVQDWAPCPHCSSSPIISNAVSVSSVLFSGCLWRRLFSPPRKPDQFIAGRRSAFLITE